MIVIQERQLAELARGVANWLVTDTLEFLKAGVADWCRGKGAEEMRALVESVVDAARSCGVREVASIKALALLKAKYDYPIPLSGYHSMLLSKKGFDESYRIAQFVDSMNEEQNFVLVTLDQADNKY